jgi:hypothetical protein
MNEDIRKMIDKVKNFKQLVNEEIGGKIKTGVDFIYKHHPELTNIGTPEQYSQYLETIFPNSKVKEIVYHSSPNKIEKFRESYFGIYFAYSPITHGGYGSIVNAALLNIKNPLTLPKNKEEWLAYDKEYRAYMNYTTDAEGYRSFKYDGSIERSSVTNNGLQVRVRDPEQIHILGSKEDVEGFKNFVKK